MKPSEVILGLQMLSGSLLIEQMPGSQVLQWLSETPALKHKAYISLVIKQ